MHVLFIASHRNRKKIVLPKVHSARILVFPSTLRISDSSMRTKSRISFILE